MCDVSRKETSTGSAGRAVLLGGDMWEICVLKAELEGFGPHNSDWMVIRQDDPEFWRVARTRVAEVQEVEDPEAYATGTRYDFRGPYEGLDVLRPGGGAVFSSKSAWWVSAEAHGGFVVLGLPVWQVLNDFTCGGIWGETPEAAVAKAWERGATLLPGEFSPVCEEGEDVFAFLESSSKAYEAAQRFASAKAE